MGIKLVSLFSFVTLILLGCSNDTQEELSVGGEATGVVLDSQVAGIRYISRGLNGEVFEGVTSTIGEYRYYFGGITEFFIGELSLGSQDSSPIVAVQTLAPTEDGGTNTIRLLQTLDDDRDPENGIQLNEEITTQLGENSLNFEQDTDSFRNEYEAIRPMLFSGSSGGEERDLVSGDVANEHAERSQRLATISDIELGRVLSNQKNYSSNFYNSSALQSSQRKRVYLYIWESILLPSQNLALNLAAADVELVDKQRETMAQYVRIADAIYSVAMIGKDANRILANLGSLGPRSFSYKLTQVGSLGFQSCSASIQVSELNNLENPDESSAPYLCEAYKAILNPFGSTESGIGATYPILSRFLPAATVEIGRFQALRWNILPAVAGRRAATISKASRPDPFSLFLQIEPIVNDSINAYRASSVADELTSRLIAREWLGAWFRSGADLSAMSLLLTNGSDSSVVSRDEQIDLLAVQLGSPGILCGNFPFVDETLAICDGSNASNINFDRSLVNQVIADTLSTSNRIFRNLTSLLGPLSNENLSIGTVAIDLIQESEPEPIRRFLISPQGQELNGNGNRATFSFFVSNSTPLENVSYTARFGSSSQSGNIRSVGGCPGTFPGVNVCGGFGDQTAFEDSIDFSIDNSHSFEINSEFEVEWCNAAGECSQIFSYEVNLAAGSTESEGSGGGGNGGGNTASR